MRLLASVLVQICLLSPAVADDEKSPELAVGLSLGVTAAGAVTLITVDNESLQLAGLIAVYVGPSTGQWYAGRLGGLGLAARAAGGVAAISGLALVVGTDCEIDVECGGVDQHNGAGVALMIAGAGLWVGSSIYDVVLAKRAADSWNARHAITLAPSALGPQRAPGLVLAGRF